MTLKKYIIDNYEKEFSKPAPKHLIAILNSFNANKFSVEKFTEYFNLDSTSPLAIIEFVMNENNSYEIGKFGYRVFETQKDAEAKIFTPHRKRTTSDETYDYEQGKFSKKFK